MSPIKNVWYEVRYREPISFGGKVQLRLQVKCFKDRKRAQSFFDELTNDYDKWLVLIEESVCDVVYSKN